MRILVTGAGGGVGRGLIPALLEIGHQVIGLDAEAGADEAIVHPRFAFVRGGVEEPRVVEEAVRRVEAVVHLAWSFSDDPRILVERDLRGHALLLEAARRHRVGHFLYASTAVVYGKPVRVPLDETHPLEVLTARKPAYGIAKVCAEQLTLLAGQETGLACTVLRFWWAFGEEIAGRHLREMLQAASEGKALAVPAECGGSFLAQGDLNRAVEALLQRPAPAGRVYNLASAYVGWDEVARMALEVTGGTGGIALVPREAWTGPAFLADRWELDDARIRAELEFAPGLDPAGVRGALAQAIGATWARIGGRAGKPGE